MASDLGRNSFFRGWSARTLAIMILMAYSAAAEAQLTQWGNSKNIYVDQRVLGGSVPRAAQRPAGTLPRLSSPNFSRLLPPPDGMPQSRLLVKTPPSGLPSATAPSDAPRIKLRPPSATKRKARHRTKAKVTPQQAPKLPTVTKPAKPLAPPKPNITIKLPKPPQTVTKPPAPVAAREKAAAVAPIAKKPSPTAAKLEQKTASVAPPPPAIAKPILAAPVTKPSPPLPQQTARRSGTAPVKSARVVAFTAGGAKLAAAERANLDKMAERMKQETGVRLQLLAYAGEPNLSASKARRLSLSRALAVRSYLIDKGVRSTRIDVRALGNRLPGGAPSRVDLVVK